MAIPLPDLVAWQGVAAAAFRALVVHRRVESTLETSAVFEVDWWLTVLSRPQVNEAVHNFWRTLRLEWEEQVVAVGELDRLALEAYLLDGSSVFDRQLSERGDWLHCA